VYASFQKDFGTTPYFHGYVRMRFNIGGLTLIGAPSAAI
jgi:hypothetical protein